MSIQKIQITIITRIRHCHLHIYHSQVKKRLYISKLAHFLHGPLLCSSGYTLWCSNIISKRQKTRCDIFLDEKRCYIVLHYYPEIKQQLNWDYLPPRGISFNRWYSPIYLLQEGGKKNKSFWYYLISC